MYAEGMREVSALPGEMASAPYFGQACTCVQLDNNPRLKTGLNVSHRKEWLIFIWIRLLSPVKYGDHTNGLVLTRAGLVFPAALL